MVEGGRIDHAGHMPNTYLDIKTGRTIDETVEFARAVQVAVDWAADRDDTLIIVTADHETGGMLVGDPHPQAGVLPKVHWSGSGHKGVSVPLAAWGVRADSIHGQMDNTDLFAVVTTQVPIPQGSRRLWITGVLLLVGCVVGLLIHRRRTGVY